MKDYNPRGYACSSSNINPPYCTVRGWVDFGFRTKGRWRPVVPQVKVWKIEEKKLRSTDLCRKGHKNINLNL
jgi:hypothetical protein